MKVSNSILRGTAGALALNIVHETYRQIDKEAQRVDLLGKAGVSKELEVIGVTPPTGKALPHITFASNLAGNTAFYNLIGTGDKYNILWRGAGYGLAVGLGALLLTKPVGVVNEPTTTTSNTKVLTLAWYVLGGIIAAAAIKKLAEREVIQIT